MDSSIKEILKLKEKELEVLKEKRVQFITTSKTARDRMEANIKRKEEELENIRNTGIYRKPLIRRSKLIPQDKMEVSEHAIVRYVERVMKIDIDSIKRNILNSLPEQIPLQGARIYNSFTVVVRGRKVITIF